MRVAVILVPSDTTSSDAVTWLSPALVGLGFRVAIVDGADGVDGRLAEALRGLSPEDDVLVHLSGHLVRRGVLRGAGGRWLPLRTLGEALAAHAGANVSLFAELIHPDDADDAFVAADHLASCVAALGARERGYAVVAALRPATAAIEGLAFTRLVLAVADAAPRGQAQLSTVYRTATAMPQSLSVAQSLTFVRGRSELDLAPPPPAPLDLDARIEGATEARDWRVVVDLKRERLATMTSPRQRGKELVGIARILQVELGDADSALAALEEARSVEPRRLPVLQALRRGYESLGRWASAIEAVGALAALAPMSVDRGALRFAQARMALDHLQDEERALTWLEQAIEDDPRNADARALLGRLRSSIAPPGPTSPPEAHREPSYAPAPLGRDDELDPSVYARIFAERQSQGRTDGAFLAALALEELGAPSGDAQGLVEELRSVGPVRARGSLDASAWALLRPPATDEVLRALFGAVARAGVLSRLEQLVARGRLIALDAGTRLDEASTASVVRSFQWAARVLSVPAPELYLVDEVPGEIAAVRAPSPTTAVGPSIVSGRSAKDLAFLAGRHLTYYVAEHHVQLFFPTREELTRLMLASVQVARPGVPPSGDGGRAIVALAERLVHHMTDAERARLTEAVRELEARGGRFSLGAWTRNVELIAARTGLLLCGDLATAMAIVTTESREISGLTLEAKRRDLIAFCASDEHADLRERCAVTAQALPARAASTV